MSTCELDRELHTSVLKREEAKEKAYRDERNRIDEEFHSNIGMGGTEMSKKELKKIIDSDRRVYYRTEELNDKLYIHYKGWRELQNLEGWTGLKTLYAECNAFSYMTGLQNCRMLRSLFLQENCIKEISGLQNLTELWSLNLASNFIERIEGLEGCTGLNTLIISKNKLGFKGLEDVAKLADTGIYSLDIQDNKIDDPDVLPEVFSRMKNLRVLYMKGNPAAKKIVNYRKSTTVYCKDLRYLDDRPVFEDDRRGAEAFNRGGIEEERAEKKRIRQEKTDAHDRNMRAFQQMIENSRKEKRERDGMRAEDQYTDETDPVESFERRAKRLTDKWKEENPDVLKDDAKIHAEKCLKAEREKEGPPTLPDEAEQEDDRQQAAAESRDKAAAESGDTGAAELGKTEDRKEDNRKLVYEDIWDDAGGMHKKPVDNRKLAYEDIWDDVPHKASGVPSRPAPSQSSPAGPPASLGPAAASEGLFMPWAEGAVGMDALEPSKSEKEALEKRKAALRSKAAESAAAGDDAEAKPSWHSKYLEQVAKTQAKINAAAPAQSKIFAPPARTTAEPHNGWPAAPAASSPVEGAGELDEMD